MINIYKKGFTIYPGKVANFNTFRVANIGEIDYKDETTAQLAIFL